MEPDQKPGRPGARPAPGADHAASLTRTEIRLQAPEPGPGDLLTQADLGPFARRSASQAPPRRVPPRPGDTLDHYELIRELGRGGMGSVFLARDTVLGRLVAIKVLTRLSGSSAQRFLVEARATALCKHESIVVIHEVSQHDGYPYMVLEHIEGQSLRRWMEERRPEGGGPDVVTAPVPPSLAVSLMLPVVRALACAHQLGIVHRDLKPDNVMLDTAGPIKVLDFGIAKVRDREAGPRNVDGVDGADGADGVDGAVPAAGEGRLTGEGAMLGTLPYMSPEQWGVDEIDARSDLWAVGIMLYELVVGRHPLAPVSAAALAGVTLLDEPMPRVTAVRPDLAALGAVVDRCLRKRRSERPASALDLLAALQALEPGRQAPSLGEGENPFTGLSAFQEADALRFFGREREVAGALGRLLHHPLLAIVGPSGAGKSSFVRAGLIPALKRSDEAWEAIIVRPGGRPLAALAELCAEVSARSAGGRAAGETSAAALGDVPGHLGATLRAHCREAGRRVLLFVDQLEELYTLGAGEEERAAFVACLTGAADDASSPLRVVLSLRSDFLDRIAEDQRLLAEVTRGLSLLPPIGREGLREALVRPIEDAGHHFEDAAMVDGMLAALERTRSPLPLLQFTASRLWEARDRERRLLTRRSHEEIGGVEGALSTHADAVLAGLPPASLALCRAVVVRLVTPERTRAVVSVRSLRDLAGDGEAVERVVQHLADARLLLVEGGALGEGRTVELVHESLIERWPRLGEWLDESQQDAQFLARLRAAAQPWEASEEAPGLLWRDHAARDAGAWLARRRAELGPRATADLGRREERYLLAVVALAERSRRQRRRALAGVFAALGAVALGMSLLGVRASREAVHARAEAARADQEASRAQAEAREARNATRMAAARELQADPTTVLALLREVEPPGMPRGWSDLAPATVHREIARAVLTHPENVESAAWSPDGTRIVTAGEDRTARVWRTDGADAGREILVLRGHEGMVLSAAWSPDGTRLATASLDRTVRIWSAGGPDAGRELRVLRGHAGIVLSVAWSPDGKRIVTASLDRTARVWSAAGAREPLVLRAHEAAVEAAAWSPDGARVATASDDRTVRVWSADGAEREPLVLRGHTDIVDTVAWSPDGKRLVSASQDQTARVWSVDGGGDGRELLVLRGHGARVVSAAWSPDGRRLVTASRDQTARVWSADGGGDGREPLVLRGHDGPLTSAAWSPDGKRVVTTSLDRTARVWSADGTGPPLILRGHEDAIYAAAFSPDGRRVVTASWDKTARIWNADGTGEAVVLRGHEGIVDAASFSPDGRRVVTASWDKTARIWNADGTGEALVLRGHEGIVYSAAWSPDGKRLVTASWDETARVWSADGTGDPLVLRGHAGRVSSAAWSPDGARIVTASLDRTARVWSDLAPLLGADDPRLWTRTGYCMPVERRMALLSLSEPAAEAEQRACRRRVEEARPAGGGRD